MSLSKHIDYTDPDSSHALVSPVPSAFGSGAKELDPSRAHRPKRLAPRVQEEIEGFERSSFRMTYVIVGFAAVAVAFTCVLAVGMIILAAR